jgi:hypothetical protein
MKKKLLLLLFLINISTVIAQNFTVSGVNYSIIPSTTNVEVSSNQCFTGILNLPSTVTYNSINYNVASIGNSAFDNCSSITSITIPNSVISIGASAFNNCTNLSSITIPNSIIAIGAYVFAYCTSLTSVTIPDSVTSIGAYTFNNCTSLNTINIGNSVQAIGNYTFFNCSSLTSVAIPNSVTSIGNGIFDSCINITSITIPDSVTSIGSHAFNNCISLPNLVLPSYIDIIRVSTFYNCTSLTSVTIPKNVTSIGNDAFFNCSSLSTVFCYIITPLVINSSVFQGVNQGACTLNVPIGSDGDYQVAPIWELFIPINGVLLNSTSFNIKKEIVLYPNPVQNELFLVLNNSIELQKVNFYNSLGQLIKTSNTNTTINVSDLVSGSYFVEIITNQGKVTKTIIVQ